jgi:hypothetical protein
VRPAPAEGSPSRMRDVAQRSFVRWQACKAQSAGVIRRSLRRGVSAATQFTAAAASTARSTGGTGASGAMCAAALSSSVGRTPVPPSLQRDALRIVLQAQTTHPSAAPWRSRARPLPVTPAAARRRGKLACSRGCGHSTPCHLPCQVAVRAGLATSDSPGAQIPVTRAVTRGGRRHSRDLALGRQRRRPPRALHRCPCHTLSLYD